MQVCVLVAEKQAGSGKTGNEIKGGTMIDSNQNDFAGAVPVSSSPANWNWLKDRVQASVLEPLQDWFDTQLAELESDYEGWVTAKSLQLALRSELRESRSE